MNQTHQTMQSALKALEGLLNRTSAQAIYSFMETERRIAISACVGLREALAEQPAQQEPDRVKFERHWRKTRGEKKASRELPRHPLQPQTYIQDSANRHWVTWQAAVRSVAQPTQQQEPVGEIGKIVMFGGDLKEVSWKNGKMPPVGSALYTSPPARKPLTDEQLADFLGDEYHDMTAEEERYFRLAEAAHGIKEQP